MAIKVAAVHGPVRRFLVGDPEIQRVEVIAGQVLDQLAAVEGLAWRGEVLVPAKMAARLSDLLVTAGTRQSEDGGLELVVLSGLTRPVPPQPWPEELPAALSVDQCRPWLSPSVFERVRSSSKAFLAELRPVTALFLLFRGIEYEIDPRAGEKLDEFIRRVQSIITQHEGTLIQITIGDKGSYLSVAFGAPVAHPDDPFRAVWAAGELEKLPRQLAFIHTVQIGIAQGEMRTGAYGSSAMRTYGMMGDKVNLAARLMQAATNGILCDESVFHAVHAAVDMVVLPPIKVKGKDEWIPIYRPAGEKQAGTRRKIALTGREQEQAILLKGLENLQAGTGGVILIEGETGLGKTLLLDALAGWAGERGLQVFRGGTSLEQTRSLPGMVEKQAPAVFLIDEAQDLDPAFWEMALSLAQQDAPAYLAIATRPLPMPLPEAYLQLFMLPDTERINLAPLSPDEITALACQNLRVDTLSGPLQSLLAGSSGNPYFILETVNLLRETGALLVQDRRAALAPGIDLDAIRIPSSVQGVVASRLDRLTLEEHLVLKVASVVGRIFPLHLLRAIYPVEEHKERLEELLQSLEWQDLVTATEEGRFYRFNQPVTLELAYNSMLFSQRRQLHRQVGEWYEGHLDEEGCCPFEELSGHWLKAGEPMKALHYLEKAGQEAYQRGELAEAERLFQACLELESKAAVIEEGDLEPGD